MSDARLPIVVLATALVASLIWGWSQHSRIGELEEQLVAARLERPEGRKDRRGGERPGADRLKEEPGDAARPEARELGGPSQEERKALRRDQVRQAREQASQEAVATFSAEHELDKDTTAQVTELLGSMRDEMADVRARVDAGELDRSTAAPKYEAIRDASDLQLVELLGEEAAAELKVALAPGRLMRPGRGGQTRGGGPVKLPAQKLPTKKPPTNK